MPPVFATSRSFRGLTRLQTWRTYGLPRFLLKLRFGLVFEYGWKMRLLILIFAAALLLPTHAYAWNARGHQYIADIAESLLTEPARNAVDSLLASQGKERLRDVAAWADQIRALNLPEQPSHAVRTPWDTSYSAKRDCPKQACALGTLTISARLLASPKTNEAARAFAMNYIVHLVGDIHQPLHVSTNREFAAVELNGEKRSLHEIWDRDITDAAIARPSCRGQLLKNVERRPVGFEQWAKQTHLIAYDIFTELGRYPKHGKLTVLTDDYVDKKSALACKLLNVAAMRLAAVLNATLDRGVGSDLIP